MLKKVLYDYADSFRWGNIKKKNNFTNSWIFIYMLTFFPIIMRMNDTIENLVCYYLGILPCLLGFFSITLIPICMPKQMFLCPMTEEERKKYIKMLFGVRIGVPFLAGIIGAAIILLLEYIQSGFVVLYLVGLFSYLFCGSITTWPGSVWKGMNDKGKYVKNPKFKGLRVISSLGMLFGIFYQLIMIMLPDSSYSGASWFYIPIFSLPPIIFDLLMIRYIKPMVEVGISFENTYEVLMQTEK